MGAVQWKATDLVISGCVLLGISGCGQVGIHRYGCNECIQKAISGCGPVGMDHCKSLGVVWRGSVLAVHWVSSGGNQWVWPSGRGPVGVSQDESAEHKGSHRCGLEGDSGCGLVGDSGCGLEESSMCSRNNHWVQYSGNH